MKNKILKRIVSLTLVAAMGLSLGACGSSDTNATSDDENTSASAEVNVNTSGSYEGSDFTIGFPTAASNTSSMAVINVNREGLAEAAGGKCVTEVFDFTPEGTIDAVQKLIEQDNCDGIMVCPVADSCLIPIMNMCEEYGVYWVTSMRNITDEDLLAQVQESEYFLGGIAEDNYQQGYAMGVAYAEAGGHYYGIISNEVTDTSAQLTEAGLAQAAEEYGLEFVEGCEVRGASQASDIAQSVESWISTYPQLDGVLRLTSTATGDTSAVCETLEKLGKQDDILFYTSDADATCISYLQSGTLNGCFNDVLYADAVLSAALLINKIQGTPLKDDNDLYILPYTMCEDYTALENYFNYIAPDEPKALMSAEQYQQNFIRGANPDLTFDSVAESAASMDGNVAKALLEEAGRD